MNNRKWIPILLIIFALLLIILIIWFLFFRGAEEDLQTTLPPVQVAVNQPIEKEKQVVANNSKVNITAPADRELTANDLSKMASSFAERFGSYSNHSNFSNILDLQIFMTRKMKNWADNQIEEAESEYKDIYYGITTKAISSEVQEFDDNNGKAIILVHTQRKESTGSMSNSSIYYQDILITYIKERDVWKVDSAYWQ